jgi:hypothetical protein
MAQRLGLLTQSDQGLAIAPPRPTQLALPFGDQPRADLPSLFHEARRVEPVLSYEQASLDQIIPDTAAIPVSTRDRLILPGGAGLILYDGPKDALAFDWMEWGGKADPAGAGASLGATISLDDIVKGARATRKQAQRRCIIPLTRYSIPIREGDIWAHRWCVPMPGQVACAAGIWIADRRERPCFAMVIGEAGSGEDHDGPVLLCETDLLTWLRAPLRDALSLLTRPG